MHQRSIGAIRQISRYPVKSMAGEDLEKAVIASYGIYGDRSHAFTDESKEGWDRYITARQLPLLLGYKAGLGESKLPDAFPQVEVTAPDGQILGWDSRLLNDIQSHIDQTIHMIRYKPSGSDLLAVDTGSILIVTDRSLHKLEMLTGNRLDIRRFRPNLVVSLSSEFAGSDEDLIGSRLRIGSTELQINEPCERCSLITIHPDTYERDVNILKKVNEEMNLNFGVYASVIQTGELQVGDQVWISEP
ncbi:MOSC domain-containing protein [Paenibacillus solisilvae]|uniref:MOSC domain-containing protein n=1 Tax=Paenibacillus solisilvae TaxID=2486751 RepID=A0ABW0VZ68_9BACL